MNTFSAKNFNGFSPEELVEAMKKTSEGCEKAFRTIFKAFSEPVASYIRKEYKLSFEVSVDLSNEIMSKVWEKSSHYEVERGHVTTWVFSLIEFHLIDYFRREQSKKNFFAIYKLILMNNQLLISDYNVSKLSLNPERIYLNSEKAEYISKLFGKEVIGESLLKAMELRYVKELSLKEVAQELNMNESTVRVNIMRGRQKIQDFVSSNLEYSEVLSL